MNRKSLYKYENRELSISEIDSWHWIVHLNYGKGFCSGNLIDNNFILSTATCCKHFIAIELTFILIVTFKPRL